MDENNLTKEQRLAYLLAEPAYVGGHDVVVVDPEGKERPRLLRATDLRRKLFSRAAPRIAWAVRATDLRHVFGRLRWTIDQVHSFTLHYRLEYRIAEPLRLVEHLSSDPLRQLEEEIDALVGGAICRLPWEVIAEEGASLTAVVFAATREAGASQGALMESVRTFATRLGFEVGKVWVDRTLPETEDVVGAGREEIEHERAIRQERLKDSLERERRALARDWEERDHEDDLIREGRKAEIDRKREELAIERDRLAEIRRLHEANLQAAESFIGAMGKESERALTKAVDGVRSAEDLPIIARKLKEAAALTRQPVGMTGAALPFAPQLGLDAGEQPADGSLALLLSRLAPQLSSLPCARTERAQLLAAALRVVAAVVEGSPEDAKPQQELIARALQAHAESLSAEQLKLLKQLVRDEVLMGLDW